MTDATTTGQRVLEALAEGRRRAIERRQADSRRLHELVEEAAIRDERAGHLVRGRAGRIARALHGMVTERGVAKILERLSSRSDSSPQYPSQSSAGVNE